MRAMSFLLDKVSNLHNALFGGRNEGGQLPNGPNGFDGPDGNGPDLNSPGLDSLPPGLQNNHGADSIPPGIAKQLDLPSPPSPPGSPFQAGGNQFQPGGNQAPNLPFNPPGTQPPGTSPPGVPAPPGGNTPVAPNPNPVTAQPVPITGGTAQPMPVPIGPPPVPPGNNGQPYVAQLPQIVQSLFGQNNAAAPAMAATPANPATANPVPPTAAAAQTAQANPALPGAPAQGLPGAVGQAAAGTTVNPNAPNPAATQAARAGEAVPQQLPQGRPDAVPVPQQREGSLLDRLMSLLRPNATTTTPQGTLAPNAAGNTAQAATATTVAAMPLAVPATQAPMDARGNTLLAVNDRVATQRGDTTLTGIYTADGPYRRALRRGSNVLSTRFSSLLMALGLAGPPVTMRGRDAEYELSVAMQWLFWLLAIVAYACLGLAVIAFLPAGSDVFGESGRAWTGGFAVAGLVAGAGAWWFARQLSGRGGSGGQASEDESDDDD
jgi:hypothetical protein